MHTYKLWLDNTLAPSTALPTHLAPIDVKVAKVLKHKRLRRPPRHNTHKNDCSPTPDLLTLDSRCQQYCCSIAA
jgi:hypothetical protein